MALPPGRSASGAGAEPPRERELKLRIAEGDLPRLATHPRLATAGPATSRPVRSVYFDTAGLALAEHGLALRVRRDGERRIQTVKTTEPGRAGLFDRAESEAPAEDLVPDPARVAAPALRAAVQRALAGRPLVPVVATQVERTSRRLRTEAADVTLDLDVGRIEAGERTVPLCELELETEAGDAGALYDLALDLLGSVPLRPGGRGKLERGLALRRGEGPRPQKAERLALEPDGPLEAALAAVLDGTLAQVFANEAAAELGEDPEGVHQMRVGLRRLRSALVLFKDVLPETERRRFRDELRWLGGTLGPARDLDVLREGLLEPARRERPDDAGLKRLAEDARELRAEAQAELREALASRRAARLLLELGRFRARAGWREQALSERSAQLFAPARDAAAELLDRRHRKALRAGRRVESLSRSELHRLRIETKKLRYAAELLRSLYPERTKRARKLIARSRDVQEALGAVNDAATAERLLDALLARRAGDAAPADHRAAGFLAGWAARDAERRLRTLPRRLEKLAAAKPFWR